MHFDEPVQPDWFVNLVALYELHTVWHAALSSWFIINTYGISMYIPQDVMEDMPKCLDQMKLMGVFGRIPGYYRRIF